MKIKHTKISLDKTNKVWYNILEAKMTGRKKSEKIINVIFIRQGRKRIVPCYFFEITKGTGSEKSETDASVCLLVPYFIGRKNETY